jgi:two-component system, sporulation sensor kinase D
MEHQWFFDFIEKEKDSIVNNWAKVLKFKFPSFYHPEKTIRDGYKYLNIVMDIEQPIQGYPNIGSIPMITMRHVELGGSLKSIIHITQLYRGIVLDSLWNYCIAKKTEHSKTKDIFNILNQRMDYLQKIICDAYWDYSKNEIETKEQTISQLHRDRLSLLGQMASSMAHEIKNPLFAMEGFLKLIRRNLDEPAKVDKYLEVIEHEFEGLYRHITAFLSFSKNNTSEEQVVNLHVSELFNSALELLNPRFINENVEVKLLLEEDPIIMVQKNAIQQVILNLLTNSIDALYENSGEKVIVISAYLRDSHVYISIIDNGPGIPEHLQEVIFEPFSTGKQSGTGLGLAICKQIIEKSGGEIAYSSSVGRTEFTFTLSQALKNVYT